MQAASACFIVAGDDDLFLLYREGQAFEGRGFGFEHGGVEAVVVLEVLSEELAVWWAIGAYKVDDHPPVFSRRDFSGLHLGLMVVAID